MDDNTPQTEPRQDTLDFIFEHTKHGPELQLRDAEALDAKIVQVLGVASVVIGLTALGIGRTAISTHALVFLVLALVAYVVMAVFALSALQTFDFQRSSHGDILWNQYWQDDPEQIKHALVADIARAYANNKRLLTAKSGLLFIVVMSAAAEVLFVGIFVVATVFSTSP
ncbi:MAG: hypothetical protein JW846_06155 [Dehalococcoidia bacterium]|nr:hypothetical protein [Dehalococcoidia bacterium]